MPEAVTENEAGVPTVAVTEAGAAVIVGPKAQSVRGSQSRPSNRKRKATREGAALLERRSPGAQTGFARRTVTYGPPLDEALIPAGSRVCTDKGEKGRGKLSDSLKLLHAHVNTTGAPLA